MGGQTSNINWQNDVPVPQIPLSGKLYSWIIVLSFFIIYSLHVLDIK